MTKIELPNDMEALKDLVIQEYQRAELFKNRHDLLVRRYFGRSSEKRSEDPSQLLLFELPTEAEVPMPAHPAEDAKTPRRT